MNNIALFASGSGSNVENIILYFKNHPNVNVDSVWSNNINSYVLERAQKLGIESHYFSRSEFYHSDYLLNELKNRKIKLVVLSGFLWLVPKDFIQTFSLINIHPSLLPAYGGKGMYGSFVHEAVLKNKESESGITIHQVDMEYDKGKHLLQVRCPVLNNDTVDSLANRIHLLEYEYFPVTIENFINTNFG